MKEKNTMRKRIAVLVVALVIAILAVGQYRYLIVEEIQKQLLENLKDVANQNIVTMEDVLKDNSQLLSELAVQIEKKYDNIDSQQVRDEIVDFLVPFMDIYEFKRMGSILPDGTA